MPASCDVDSNRDVRVERSIHVSIRFSGRSPFVARSICTLTVAQDVGRHLLALMAFLCPRPHPAPSVLRQTHHTRTPLHRRCLSFSLTTNFVVVVIGCVCVDDGQRTTLVRLERPTGTHLGQAFLFNGGGGGGDAGLCRWSSERDGLRLRSCQEAVPGSSR